MNIKDTFLELCYDLGIKRIDISVMDILMKHFHDVGGNEQVSKERKWNKIASRMGFPANKSLGALLKAHYERILQPYDIFNKGKLLPQVVS